MSEGKTTTAVCGCKSETSDERHHGGGEHYGTVPIPNYRADFTFLIGPGLITGVYIFLIVGMLGSRKAHS